MYVVLCTSMADVCGRRPLRVAWETGNSWESANAIEAVPDWMMDSGLSV